VVIGWAAARTEVRLHALTAAVAVLEARLAVVEAKRPRRSR
jgi:BMFP domain-containing protein YqiC